jgi:hypothetical protein
MSVQGGRHTAPHPRGSRPSVNSRRVGLPAHGHIADHVRRGHRIAGGRPRCLCTWPLKQPDVYEEACFALRAAAERLVSWSM